MGWVQGNWYWELGGLLQDEEYGHEMETRLGISHLQRGIIEGHTAGNISYFLTSLLMIEMKESSLFTSEVLDGYFVHEGLYIQLMHRLAS